MRLFVTNKDTSNYQLFGKGSLEKMCSKLIAKSSQAKFCANTGFVFFLSRTNIHLIYDLSSFHLVTDNSPLASYFYISGIQPDTEYGSQCIRLSKKSDSRPKNAAAFF